MPTTNSLAGVQFVDDAHVPHHSDTRYFLDKYASGEFHPGNQVVGGVSVGSAGSTTGAEPTGQGGGPSLKK